MNALIVDDSSTARILMRRIMESLGFSVREAGLAKVALQEIAATRFDVILLDWNMPDLAGVDLVMTLRQREMRDRQPDARQPDDHRSDDHLPILMVTQNVEKEHIVQALDVGVDEYLMKPFTAKSLREKLLLMGILDVEPAGSDSGL